MSQFKSFNIDDLYSFPGGGAKQARAGAQGAQQPQQPQPEGEEFGVFDYAADAALGIPRGLLGGFSDIADLATMPFDYDVPDYFGLMEESKTVVGGVTEGISSFMTGFIPGLGVASKLGKVGKIAGVVNKIDDIAAAAKLAGKAKKAAAITGAQAFVKGSVAGAVADFASFDGHESRLSNLLQEYTPLRDPITSFLAADENDSEIVGRLKNAIEGLAIGGITEGLFNSIRLYKAGFVAKNGGRNVDEAIALEYVQIRREQRSELKESFGLTDEQAEAANILIDRMGIDRSRLRIVAGEQAISEYGAAAGTALEQRVKFDAKAAIDANDPIAQEVKNLLDDEEFASIRSQGGLDSLVSTYKRFRDEVMPRLQAATEAGAAVEGGYLEGAEIMRTLVGDTRTELFAMFSAATSPQNKVSMHTRLGVALTADLIDRFRSGNFVDLSVEEMTKIMNDSMVRVDAKGMANQYAKRAVTIANDLASRLRAAQAANPAASADDLINGIDTSGLYKNMAGTDMAKGAGKVPGFAEGSAGRLNKPVLDTYMARLVPSEWFPNVKDPKELLDAKKNWLATSSNYTAFSANIRKLAQQMKIAPGNVQERAWGTIGVVSALLNAGATPDIILKNIDERDMLASWDLLSILQRQDVTNELKRLGADEGSLADLARIAADVRKRVRPNLGKPVSVSDTGKFEEFAGRISDTARGAGSEVIAARKARGATLLRQETRRVTDRVPELQEAAQRLKAGKITKEEYDRLVNQYKPVRPYESVPAPISKDQAVAALTSDKAPRFGQASASLQDGAPVGLRLDIPAYRDHGAWVVSVHEQQPGFAAGKSIGYESTASVTGATFGMSEPAALAIAGGKPKGTIATIKGQWRSLSPEQAKALADDALNNPEWRQVGMDPERHSFFYDRDSMRPITAADEVIQVGPLVLAKNPQYGEASKFLYQTAESEVRGFASFSDDGKALIGGLSNPNVSTAIEEIGHVARRQLFDKTVPQSARMGISNADIDTIAKWSGAAAEGDNWVWGVDAEEKFAAGLLKYIRDGEAPAGLEGLFRKLSKWMVSLYRDITGTDLDMKLSKEVREVFDNLVERGPGFDKTAAAAGEAASNLVAKDVGTAVLRSTRNPTEVSPGSVGLGMPGGTPDKPINLERFSSIDEVNAEIDRVISEPSMAAAMDEDAQPLTEVVANAQKAYDSLVDATGEGATIDFRKMLEERMIGRWELQDAITQLQGLRKFAASAGNRLVELAKKGRASSPEEMYEFLAGRRSLEVALLAIKERQREFARGLNAMNIVPEPDKAFTFMPSLPKPGEVVPPAGAATPPAGAVPPPAAGAPAPGTLAPEPAGAPRMPGEAPEGAVAPEAAPATPAVPEAAPAVPEAIPAIDPLADPAARAEIIAKFIEQAGGIEAVQATMTRYAAAAAAGGEDAVLRMARGQKGWMNALVEFWMNNILSGPVTHAVNASANMLTALYLPFERMLGATLRADMKTAQTAMRQYTYLFQQMGDALRIAGVALKMDENVLDTVVTKETQGRAISAAGLGMNEDTVGGMAANWVGKVLNIPTRLLSAEDEFFKQLNYRASFLSELYVDGLKKFKGDTASAAKYAQETFNKAITDGQAYALDVVLKRAGAAADKAVTEGTITAADRGTFISKFMADKENWDPRLGAMSNRSLNNSRYATFSTPLSTEAGNPVTTRVAARFQAAANEHPVLRFVLPFIRTPTNLLNFTLERTLPLTAFSDSRAAFGEYGKLLKHKDAAVRADAMGRLAFSATVVSTVGAAAYAGTITGGGPKNAGERQTLQQAGWQPYSIKIGDAYYSYRREDPFASIIGLVADLMEGYKYAEERNMDTLGSATNTLVLAIARNVTNKTYLTGITNVSNALSNPEQFGPTLVNQYVSSLVPFSSALDQSKATVADDPILRDARNMLDAARAKVPFLAEGVTPRRNVLGEVMKKSEGLGPDIFSPVMYTQVTDDRILQEFGLLGHGFTSPKAMKGALDLTTFKTSGGQEAYDRWLELHGKVRVSGRTLRDDLLRTINSPTYQQLSPDTTDDYDSPRVRVLRGIISKYREAAYKQLLKESPELNRASKMDYANKQALRMGRSAQELFDLANR